jgi:hypothetical protein
MMEMQEPTGETRDEQENLSQLESESSPPQEATTTKFNLAPTKAENNHNEELSESKELARLLALTTSDDPEESVALLANYFKIKKAEGLFAFEEDPERLAQEIRSIEEKIKTIEFSEDLKEEEKTGFENSVREALISTVLSGKVSAETILGRLNSVTISKTAGEEIGEYDGDIGNLAAFFKVEAGVSSLYLYEKATSEDPTHHFQHEMGHIFAETGAIWDQEVFLNFLEAVSEMDEAKIKQIAEQAPELIAIYNLIKDPNQAIFFRPYIKDKLSELGSLEEGQLPQARMTAAKEIIAEMTAFYLESADSELSYFNARLQYLGGDAIELCKKIIMPEKLELLIDEGGSGTKKTLTTEEIFDFIKNTPEFKADFEAQRLIIAKMKNAFDNRGSNIKPMSETMATGETISYADENFGDDNQLIFRPGAGGSISGGDHDTSFGNGQSPESPLAMVWSTATGQKESLKTPLSP